MRFTHLFALAATAVDITLAQGTANSNTAASILSLISKLIPGTGIVVTNGGLDVSASVCETFKPENWLGKALSPMFGSPYYGGMPCEKDTSGGSGKYKSNYTTDPTLPSHTIYAPNTPPPASEKLPVLIWGNGACLAVGTMFQNFLTEVASHGFLVVANGDPVGLSTTSYKDLLTSIDWVTNNPAAKKYGNIDLDNIAIAGQSCGGGEAYQASLNSTKHKLTIMFNSGFNNRGGAATATLTKPIAYFLGGKTDIATSGGTSQYNNLPSTVPALLADADVGHIGTYYQMGGGKIGKAGVAFMKWKLKGDESLKGLFCSPNSALTKDGWDIKTKNGMC